MDNRNFGKWTLCVLLGFCKGDGWPRRNFEMVGIQMWFVSS